MNEIWRDIPGYEEKYQISNFGRVRSLKWHRGNKLHILKLSRYGKGYKEGKGYARVALTKNGVTTRYNVARLEWEVFYGPIPEGMQINHINECTLDNRLENLNLMSPKENNNWGTRIERAASAASKRLTNRKDLSRPVIHYDKNGNLLKRYGSVIEAERQTGHSQTTIRSWCRGKTTPRNKHIWKYEKED